jgi:arylsulfatase
MSFRLITIFLCFVTILGCSPAESPRQELPPAAANPRPNFLLIVADDLGWTDISSFGSEINTANIDALAASGTRFTDFHVSVSCSPTRSMLMTGTDNHIAGLGTMSELLTDELRGKPGYEGHLNDSVVTLAEVLRDGGYHTYMAGKWHLGEEPEHLPVARGFDDSFSMLYGGASYWSDMGGILAVEQEVAKYVQDDQFLDSLPADFYATRNYTDTLMNMIRANRGDNKPFFAYLAFSTVHDPLHVPEPWLSQHKGNYDNGYADLKARRAEGAKRAGVFPADANAAQLHPMARDWDSFSDDEKAFQSKAMEVYAGMVSNMDYHIGRVVDFLKDIGEYDNTVIIFFSDNGSNPARNEDYSPGEEGRRFLSQFDNSIENLGQPNSHYAYGAGWGSAASGPLNQFKLTPGEGGVRSPLIVTGPGIKEQHQVESFAYITDIMPTMLEMANIQHPETYMGREVAPMRGRSVTGLLSDEQTAIYGPDESVGAEMAGGKWLRRGDYKAVLVPPPFGPGTWQLFNMAEDPGETNDLSSTSPEILAELKAAWQLYADEVGVVEISGPISR